MFRPPSAHYLQRRFCFLVKPELTDISAQIRPSIAMTPARQPAISSKRQP